MPQQSSQILSVAQMRAAEEALMAAGDSVDVLMQRAGRGAADYVWRLAAGRRVTVLCGPGNNGGDGYVIAETIRERGGEVCLVAASEPRTDAARTARSRYQGEILDAADAARGDVLIDCLYGSGLTRPLAKDDAALLLGLARGHRHAIAVDLPSGVASDSGMLLAAELPHYDMTLALGAWKFAHFLMPAMAAMGALRLIGIGVGPVDGAAQAIGRPRIAAPAADAHKYRRGMAAVTGGDMPGAAELAARAAQHAGAGYVKLLADKRHSGIPADLVAETAPLAEVLGDSRIGAVLVGPGLGRHGESRERLVTVLASGIPAVLDADALVLLSPRLLAERSAPLIATPHEGELMALERAFGCEGSGSKVVRAQELARASGMVVVAKGPDTVIAAPDGRIACAPRASSWLSVAGTGDVLAGLVLSRLACGMEPFAAAAEAVWLHGEAAHLAGPAFTAGDLALAVRAAFGSCL